MTSQKSSLSTFSFTFWAALKGNFVLPLINLIALTIIIPVTSFMTIKGYTGNNYDPRTGALLPSSDKITDLYKYLIFDQNGQITSNVFLHLSVIAFSILLGVLMFRFIASKKTVNVFYSLGITRKNLFVSKYLAGILMLSISIILPFLASLAVNISTFGSSGELWSAIIYHILGYCALSFTAFSLTAAVFSCVGTIIEGITFSGIIMLGPTMLFYGIQFLMKKLTFGSPYGHFLDSNNQVTNALATSLSNFNPILFLFKNVSQIGMLSRASKDVKFVWNAPNYSGIIIWFIAAAALFGLAMILFQKRKAEICGFLGVNKWLNFAITFLVGFFPLTIAVSNSSSVLTGILIGTAIYIFLYLIIDFALIRNFKEWAKALYKLPVHLGVSLLIILVFATGLFGFSSRIPSVENIESAEIGPVSYSGIVSPLSSNGYGDGDFLFSVGLGNVISGFKSSGDLKTITALHKLIIDAGRLKVSEIGTTLPIAEQVTATSIRISYHLKNGRTVSRFYDSAKMATITAMLAIDETERYKELIVQNLTEPITGKDSDETAANKSVFQAESAIISIIPNKMNISHKLILSTVQRAELLKALAKDLTAQTIQEKFFPETPALGSIQFSTNSNPQDAYGKVPQASGSEVQFFGLAGYGAANIVITKDMVNTLNFLQTNGFMKLFDNSSGSDFVAVQVLPATKLRSDFYYLDSQMSFHFMGGWNKVSNEYSSFINSYRKTDKALINEIAANAHISYFNSVKGYFVRFEIKDGGGYTTMYVPANKMPQSVVDDVAVFVQVQPQYPNGKYAP